MENNQRGQSWTPIHGALYHGSFLVALRRGRGLTSDVAETRRMPSRNFQVRRWYSWAKATKIQHTANGNSTRCARFSPDSLAWPLASKCFLAAFSPCSTAGPAASWTKRASCPRSTGHGFGVDPRLYLPLFRFVQANRLPIVALNVDRETNRRVAAEDSPPSRSPHERASASRRRPPQPTVTACCTGSKNIPAAMQTQRALSASSEHSCSGIAPWRRGSRLRYSTWSDH